MSFKLNHSDEPAERSINSGNSYVFIDTSAGVQAAAEGIARILKKQKQKQVEDQEQKQIGDQPYRGF